MPQNCYKPSKESRTIKSAPVLPATEVPSLPHVPPQEIGVERLTVPANFAALDHVFAIPSISTPPQ